MSSYLNELYPQIERIRMELWREIQQGDNTVEIQSLPKMPGARAEYRDRVLRVIIDDYLPRLENVKGMDVRRHWIGLTQKALLNLDVVFEMAFCVIVAYVPGNGSWDADNRVYKYVLDGLRYAGIFKDDTWDRMAFTVIGKVDKNYPRTEVYVTDDPEKAALILGAYWWKQDKIDDGLYVCKTNWI